MSDISDILDRDSDAVLRAFWRRVRPIMEQRWLEESELPEKIPVQLSANMRTALNALRLDDLETRLAAAEADAERLDWLDTNLEKRTGWRVGVAKAGNIVVTSVGLSETTIRAAIDGARGGE